jgi:hypothetical protein
MAAVHTKATHTRLEKTGMMVVIMNVFAKMVEQENTDVLTGSE